MNKLCRCGKEIHPQRLKALPNTTTCVDCSNVNKKGGVTVMKGTGEDTYVETVIMEHDEILEYNKAKTRESKLLGIQTSDTPFGD